MGIKINKPIDFMLQQLTWLLYYASNMGKRGVHIQSCMWMGTIELYKGAISDFEYFNILDTLSEQEEFQKNNDGSPFVNILHILYWVMQAAWRKGNFFL